MYLSGMDSPGGVNLQSTSEDDGSSQGTSDLELENLEKENTAFQKEIAGLRRELEQYSKVLEEHEATCTLLRGCEVQNLNSALCTRGQPIPETDILASNWPDLSFFYPVL
ncbi:UNVERIFIED_CONTAM: hypothetical protein FKN15_012002 [Acipenser sinensis]